MRTLDWGVMVIYVVLALCIGAYFTRRASRGIESYFVGGRSLPWWAIGFSTVATFTSAGAASAFTMLAYAGGLLGNWWWWVPWMIWMPLVAVIWSKFWRRLNIWGEIAALVGGLPLGYLIWFPLGFDHKPFWQGFLLLFGAGWLVIVVVTLLTPPEKQETLEEFYRLCRPPGFWGRVTDTLPAGERRRIRKDLLSDIWECALGITFCTGSVALTASLFARHWAVSAVWLVVTVATFRVFIRRWAEKGIFKSLRGAEASNHPESPDSHPQ